MAKPIAADPQGRICRGCETFKPWENFDKKGDGFNGHHAHCKECVGRIKRKWWKKKNTKKRVRPTVIEFSKADIKETFVPFNSHEKSELEKILRSMVFDSFCSKKEGQK